MATSVSIETPRTSLFFIIRGYVPLLALLALSPSLLFCQTSSGPYRCFEFSGTVSSVQWNDTLQVSAFSQVHAGDVLTGFYTYNEDVSDVRFSFDTPPLGIYNLAGGAMVARVGPLSFTEQLAGPLTSELYVRADYYEVSQSFQSPTGGQYTGSSVILALSGPGAAPPTKPLSSAIPDFSRFTTRAFIISDSYYAPGGAFSGNEAFIKGTLNSLVSCQTTIIDPFPALMTGAEVTSNPQQLSTLGKPVEQVVADGATQVVVRIPATKESERITVKVLSNCGKEDDPKTCSLSSSVQADGGIREVGASSGYCGDPFCNNQLVTAKMTTGGAMAFALFQAPADFARGSQDASRTERFVYLEMTYESGLNTHHKVQLLRPPVVLVHGIWGSVHSWDFLPLPGFKTYVASYWDPVGMAGGSIVSNASTILEQVISALADFRLRNSAAVSQVDIVAHSMGGLITRTLAILPGFQHPSNFNKGFVHKFLTLNTPHLGTPFATRLDQSSNTCKEFFARVPKLPVAAGVRDLRPDSGIISALATDSGRHQLSLHAFRGVASLDQIHETEFSFTRGALSSFCNDVLGFFETFNQTIFPGQAHDLIVGENSMAAGSLGLSGVFSASERLPGNYVHTAIRGVLFGPDVLGRTTTFSLLPMGLPVIDPGSPVAARVIAALNQPVYSSNCDRVLP